MQACLPACLPIQMPIRIPNTKPAHNRGHNRGHNHAAGISMPEFLMPRIPKPKANRRLSPACPRLKPVTHVIRALAVVIFTATAATAAHGAGIGGAPTKADCMHRADVAWWAMTYRQRQYPRTHAMEALVHNGATTPDTNRSVVIRAFREPVATDERWRDIIIDEYYRAVFRSCMQQTSASTIALTQGQDPIGATNGATNAASMRGTAGALRSDTGHTKSATSEPNDGSSRRAVIDALMQGAVTGKEEAPQAQPSLGAKQ